MASPLKYYGIHHLLIMSNKHINHQHGLNTMNSTRPKSKLRKRRNKAAAKVRKEVLLKALHEAVKGHAKA